jgi:hypothetical protein
MQEHLRRNNMKNGKHGVIAKIAGPGLVLAALLALVLPNPAICRAQAGTVSSTTPASRPALATAEASAQPAGQSPGKGHHEGITVHGHWTIEVRNPDSKLVKHREFENSLASGSVNGGAALLGGLLGRVVTAGSWQVALTDQYLPSNELQINEANSSASAACASLLTRVQAGNGDLTSLSCSNNLTVAGPQLGPGGISSGSLVGLTVTFQGRGVVPANFAAASIGFVGTYIYMCAASDSPTACFTDTANANNPFTAAKLDGPANGDLPPVPVSPGQTVSVTVMISFQ